MDEFSELVSATQSDLKVGNESTLYPPTTIKLALNRSYRKAGGLYSWPDLEDAKKTSTVTNKNYYDYPQTWRPDSLFRIEISDKRYGEDPDGSPMVYPDFLAWKEDNATSTDKKWTTQNRRYFISPTPTSNGNKDISVWGFKNVSTLTNDSDITIFSYSQPECNEAVVLEAVAMLKRDGQVVSGSKLNDAMFVSAEAKQILTVAWIRIKKEMSKYEKSLPMFHVPDFYGSGRIDVNNKIGNF